MIIQIPKLNIILPTEVFTLVIWMSLFVVSVKGFGGYFHFIFVFCTEIPDCKQC